MLLNTPETLILKLENAICKEEARSGVTYLFTRQRHTIQQIMKIENKNEANDVNLKAAKSLGKETGNTNKNEKTMAHTVYPSLECEIKFGISGQSS